MNKDEEVKEHLEGGLKSFYEEDFSATADELEKALKINPHHLAANFYLGHLHQLKKELKKAREKFDLVIKEAESILKEDSDNLEANYFLGAAYGGKALQEINPLALLNYQRKFTSFLNKVLKLNPNHADALWLLGRGLGLKGEFDLAISYMRKSLELRPLGDIYVDLGLIYIQKGALDEAEKALKSALSLKPQSPTVHYHLSLLYQAQRKFDQAKEESQKCEELMELRKS